MNLPTTGIRKPANTRNPAMTAIHTERNADQQGSQSGHMMITIKNGIATISGNTHSTAEAELTEHLLSQLNSVKHVINLAS